MPEKLTTPATLAYAGPPPAGPRTSRLAVVAFALAVWACPCVSGVMLREAAVTFPATAAALGPATSPVALISTTAVAAALSTVAVVRINAAGGRTRGRGWAFAGFVISAAFLVLMLGFWMIARWTGFDY